MHAFTLDKFDSELDHEHDPSATNSDTVSVPIPHRASRAASEEDLAMKAWGYTNVGEDSSIPSEKKKKKKEKKEMKARKKQAKREEKERKKAEKEPKKKKGKCARCCRKTTDGVVRTLYAIYELWLAALYYHSGKLTIFIAAVLAVLEPNVMGFAILFLAMLNASAVVFKRRGMFAGACCGFFPMLHAFSTGWRQCPRTSSLPRHLVPYVPLGCCAHIGKVHVSIHALFSIQA